MQPGRGERGEWRREGALCGWRAEGALTLGLLGGVHGAHADHDLDALGTGHCGGCLIYFLIF